MNGFLSVPFTGGLFYGYLYASVKIAGTTF